MNRLRSGPLPVVQLREALGSALDALPDSELLDRFARYADHSAFEVLVRRHGPMVFGACRRVLGNAADADDAFQAAFLVLIRKARGLRRADRLGPWLYGVACRVAMKARAHEARRAALRTEATDVIPDPSAPPEIPDWLPILDAELNALPAKYRDPLVLCELQGATRTDAAKALGVPEGTLSSRLSRGRALLRKRLLKHGTLLPAGGLSALFTANSIGRATAPAALLARTSELAKVVTGALPAGTVPVGAARLTDEVLKSMFLTKLRLAGGVLALFALVAIGLSAAALPTDAPGALPDKKGRAKATPAAVQPTEKAKAAPRPVVGPDEKAVQGYCVQGYWKLEKLDLPPKFTANAEQAKEVSLLVKYMWLLVEGDVWWMAQGNGVSRHEVKLTPERNPKWIDSPTMRSENVTVNGMRGIYRLPDAETLELCLDEGESKVRPAEFVPDDDHNIMLFRFKRHALPEVPADRRAARQPLLGAWNPADDRAGDKKDPPQSVVFTPNFAFLPGRHLSWAAYTYEVDTDKKPAWLDLTPVFTDLETGVGAAAPIYGVFARRGPNDSGLSLALGEGVKRVVRPLEFVEDKANKVRVLNLTRADAPKETEAKPVAPAPKPKVATPEAKPPLGKDDGPAQRLIKAGDFAEAEMILRARLPQRSGLDAAEDRLLLGVCVFERARNLSTKPGDVPKLAPKLMAEALELFERAADTAGRPDDEHATRVRTRAEIRRLWALNWKGESDKVLTSATALYDRHPNAVEGLIALGVLYHTYKKRGDDERAAETRKKMTAVFAKLKDKPGAFPETFGEYSRGYWEDVWFKDEK